MNLYNYIYIGTTCHCKREGACMVPPYREEPTAVYAAAFGRSLQQPNTSPSVLRPSGISERTPLLRHPDSVPALPIEFPPWAFSEMRGGG